MSHDFPDDHSSEPPVLDGQADPRIIKVSARLAAFAFPVARPFVPLVDLLFPGKGEEKVKDILRNIMKPGSLSGLGWISTAIALNTGLSPEVTEQLVPLIAQIGMAALGVVKIFIND